MTNNGTYEIRRRLANSRNIFGTPEEIEKARDYENKTQTPNSWYFQKFKGGEGNN